MTNRKLAYLPFYYVVYSFLTDNTGSDHKKINIYLKLRKDELELLNS